jgi:Leucine-rich repeat (LRR) protein
MSTIIYNFPIAKSRKMEMIYDLSYQTLTALDNIDPLITCLIVYDDKLTHLGTLPPMLKTLECGVNQLTTLPALPDSLIRLYCFSNKLKTLPDLPYNLEFLGCHNNLWGEYSECHEAYITSIKIEQHNKRAQCLGLNKVVTLPSITEWNQVRIDYQALKYQPGGEIYNRSEEQIKKLSCQ